MNDLMWTIRGHGVTIDPPRHKPGRNRSGSMTPEEVRAAVALREQGLTWEQIGSAMRRDPTNLRRRVKGALANMREL